MIESLHLKKLQPEVLADVDDLRKVVKTMKRRITLKKRCASVLLMLTMLFTFMPVIGGQQAFAGGDTDIGGIINGLNGDGTVSAGMTLTVKMTDLDDKYGGTFKAAFDNGEASAGWSISKTDFGDSNPIPVTGTYSGGVFSYTVEEKYAGRWIRFETFAEDSYYNNQTAPYKIKEIDTTPSSHLTAKFYGTNGDGSVDIASTISVKTSELFADNPWVQSQYESGDIGFVFRKSDKADMSSATDINTIADSSTISAAITPDEGGCYIALWTVEKTSKGTNACSDVIHVEPIVNVLSGPAFGGAYKGYSTYGKQYTFEVNGNMHLQTQKAANDFYIDEKIVRLYRNGVLVGEKKTSDLNATVVFKDIEVSYGTDDNLKAQLFVSVGRGLEVSGPTFSFTDQIDKLAKNKTYATAISSNKVSLKWTGVSGASGYYIYKGSKKIATVKAAKRSYTVKKKGAAKSKYKVVPFIKSGGKAFTSGSNAAKPVKNVFKYKRSINPSSHSYCTCDFVVTKVELKGSTYYVTGYAVNNRIFKCNKYSKLTVSMKLGSKKLFSKTYKNMSLNVGATKSKKITLKIKGKAGVDLAHTTDMMYLEVSQTPKWPYPPL